MVIDVNQTYDGDHFSKYTHNQYAMHLKLSIMPQQRQTGREGLEREEMNWEVSKRREKFKEQKRKKED